ncbi:MAG: putative porin [Alphaproteobacteria bacterium]|nr:putative porin [Alphaproteobacteria bacterium]
MQSYYYSRITILGGLILTCGLTHAACAEIVLDKEKQFSVYGDLRLRMESDFDGETATGASVNDRTRARIRARTGLKYTPNDWLTFDTRVRTGSNASHQSPHITIYDFNDNPTGDADINLDKWYVGAKKDNWWAWAGRNSFPFWSQDEIFWDEDATLLGAAAGASHVFEGIGTVSTSAGYFALPVGMRAYSGHLAAGELVYSKKIDDVTYSLGGDLFNFQPNRGDSDASKLLNGNGSRKYTIATLNAKSEWRMRDIPLTAEMDLLHNLQDYSATDSDAFTAQNHNQRDGYVFSFKAGDTDKQGHWLAAYYYAHIETFAVNSSYAQDEWVRWGSGGETRSSNMQGHQFNVGYAISDNLDVLARLYLAEAITTQERNDRFRVDLNYKF